MPDNTGAAQPKLKLTKEIIDELVKTMKEMEGKELERGKLIDLGAPGAPTAWYIAYST
jgi:hypothetical protein